MFYSMLADFGAIRLKSSEASRYQALIAAIAEARMAAGITQRQLAAKLHRANAFVSKIEAGKRGVSVLEFVEIAEALGIEAAALLAKI